jgi:hypothetical protein
LARGSSNKSLADVVEAKYIRGLREVYLSEVAKANHEELQALIQIGPDVDWMARISREPDGAPVRSFGFRDTLRRRVADIEQPLLAEQPGLRLRQGNPVVVLGFVLLGVVIVFGTCSFLFLELGLFSPVDRRLATLGIRKCSDNI